MFARKGYHRAIVDDIVRASGTSKGAVSAALTTFADDERLARLILLEAVSLGPTYQAKRAEVTDRFATLIEGYLDEAVADGSLAPLDTRVATLAWLGAINEVVVQWLHGGVRDLAATIPTLTTLLLRSIGSPAGVSRAERTRSGNSPRGSRG